MWCVRQYTHLSRIAEHSINILTILGEINSRSQPYNSLQWFRIWYCTLHCQKEQYYIVAMKCDEDKKDTTVQHEGMKWENDTIRAQMHANLRRGWDKPVDGKLDENLEWCSTRKHCESAALPSDQLVWGNDAKNVKTMCGYEHWRRGARGDTRYTMFNYGLPPWAWCDEHDMTGTRTEMKGNKTRSDKTRGDETPMNETRSNKTTGQRMNNEKHVTTDRAKEYHSTPGPWSARAPVGPASIPKILKQIDLRYRQVGERVLVCWDAQKLH